MKLNVETMWHQKVEISIIRGHFGRGPLSFSLGSSKIRDESTKDSQNLEPKENPAR